MKTPPKMTVKKKSVVSVKSSPAKEKEPEYMVHLGDPKMLRKEILESLRDLIIFMQGYEEFKKVQVQKVLQFQALEKKFKEINNIIDRKLKPYLPKGKLKMVSLPKPAAAQEAREMPARELPRNELDELELQLREIEGQLEKVQ